MFEIEKCLRVCIHLLVSKSTHLQELGTIYGFLLFFLRYSFLLNDTSKPQNSRVQKTSQLNAPQGNIYMGARYLDPKYSRWISTDPALGEYVPQAPVNDDAKKHNQNLPGMGGLFNSVNLSLFHYAGNNPVKYIDPDGRRAGLLNDSKAVKGFGHSAMYVETWDKYGNSTGFIVFEVGTVVMVESEDKQLVTWKGLGKKNQEGICPILQNTEALSNEKLPSLSGGSSNGSLNNGNPYSGVFIRKYDSWKDMLSDPANHRYDNVIEFESSPLKDNAILVAGYFYGRSFGKYNVFFNNCSQFVAKCLAFGGIKTKGKTIPNNETKYILCNNTDYIIADWTQFDD